MSSVVGVWDKEAALAVAGQAILCIVVRVLGCHTRCRHVVGVLRAVGIGACTRGWLLTLQQGRVNAWLSGNPRESLGAMCSDREEQCLGVHGEDEVSGARVDLLGDSV